jgi:hypothetical protein
MAIWNILQTFGIFYDQLVHFVFIWYAHFVLIWYAHFVLIWYIFPVLVACTKKNLATLRRALKDTNQ